MKGARQRKVALPEKIVKMGGVCEEVEKFGSLYREQENLDALKHQLQFNKKVLNETSVFVLYTRLDHSSNPRESSTSKNDDGYFSDSTGLDDDETMKETEALMVLEIDESKTSDNIQILLQFARDRGVSDSIQDQFKVAKCRLVVTYKDSKDQKVTEAGVTTRAGRKWSADTCVEQAESMLKLRDVIGIPCVGKQGLAAGSLLQAAKHDTALTRSRWQNVYNHSGATSARVAISGSACKYLRNHKTTSEPLRSHKITSVLKESQDHLPALKISQDHFPALKESQDNLPALKESHDHLSALKESQDYLSALKESTSPPLRKQERDKEFKAVSATYPPQPLKIGQLVAVAYKEGLYVGTVKSVLEHPAAFEGTPTSPEDQAFKTRVNSCINNSVAYEELLERTNGMEIVLFKGVDGTVVTKLETGFRAGPATVSTSECDVRTLEQETRASIWSTDMRQLPLFKLAAVYAYFITRLLRPDFNKFDLEGFKTDLRKVSAELEMDDHDNHVEWRKCLIRREELEEKWSTQRPRTTWPLKQLIKRISELKRNTPGPATQPRHTTELLRARREAEQVERPRRRMQSILKDIQDHDGVVSTTECQPPDRTAEPAGSASTQLLAELLMSKSTKKTIVTNNIDMMVCKFSAEGSSRKNVQKDVFDKLCSWMDDVEIHSCTVEIVGRLYPNMRLLASVLMVIPVSTADSEVFQVDVAMGDKGCGSSGATVSKNKQRRRGGEQPQLQPGLKPGGGGYAHGRGSCTALQPGQLHFLTTTNPT
ncbi:hypothetical protein Bbelb_291380 [Branchiostoma belcheri]|nr:hypothetical protein Bbelb_291380 [Branchiostoma belcheri]